MWSLLRAAVLSWSLRKKAGARIKAVSNRLEKAQQLAKDCQRDARDIRRDMDRLGQSQQTLRQELDNVREEVGHLQELHSRHNSELEGLRSQLKVAEEVTIPELVAAHRLVLERIDADIASQVGRRVSSDK